MYENGNPVGFLLNESTPYFYIKNLQGDICEIVNGQGKSVARYTYDAWGNLLSSEGNEFVLTLNPFTYRGYQYDRETGLYYLQSRYYSPQWCRFINADTNLDTKTSLVGTNVFAYGDNNPVMLTDPTGKSVFMDAIAAFFTIALVCVATILLGTNIFGDSNGDNYF